jgi:polyphosphate glucokinase
MHALGSYEGVKMLFLGLGHWPRIHHDCGRHRRAIDVVQDSGELGHLPYKNGTYEDYVGVRGLERSA